jgi:putative ABC transport system ATP-binding protein
LEEFGFIFQFADLVPELTLRENIELPLEFLGFGRKARQSRVDPLVETVGLQECCDQLPHTVSGGERQRAAVARAVAHRPRIVFADEPTGSLDTRSRDSVLSLLSAVSVRFACALVIVTHDPQVAQICDRSVDLIDGVIAETGW